MNDDSTPVKFLVNSALFKFKQKIAGSTGDDVTKNVEIMVPLKYFSNFWKTLEMPLINCEINLFVTWSTNFVTSNAAANQATAFEKTDTKLYVPVVTLSTDDSAKLLQQIEPGFKHTINRNKYETKTTTQNAPNQYFDFSIEPSIQGVNRLVVLTFNANDTRIGHSIYFLPTEKVENYNVMIDGRNFFDQPVKNDIKSYENIRKLQLVKEMITQLVVC